MATEEHLSAAEVAEILDYVSETEPVVVGGQSVNLWAEHYLPRDPGLRRFMPFTSKDIDFFRNKAATLKLAESLEHGEILRPGIGSASPNAAVVVGMLGGREILVDFMATVLGVDEESIVKNCIGLQGVEPESGKRITMILMNPVDCLRSRLANMNVLGRTGSSSLRQTAASVRIFGHFIDDMLAAGRTRYAQQLLHDLEFVVRDQHAAKNSDVRHGESIDILQIYGRFMEDARLDERWRTRILAPALARSQRKLGRTAGRANMPAGGAPSGAAVVKAANEAESGGEAGPAIDPSAIDTTDDGP